MPRATLFVILFLMISLTTNVSSVVVDEDNDFVIITTATYEVHWGKLTGRHGYVEAFVGNGEESVMTKGDRTFFHASEYAGGWKHWGPILDWNIVEEVPGKAVVMYVSRDTGSKEYTTVATYYDSVPYIRHEVTVTNFGADPVNAFESGHDPMFEPNREFDGMQAFDQPIPHVAYWVAEGNFAALYGPDAQEARAVSWQDVNPGRMQLFHDGTGGQLKKNESATITFYVAFARGDDKDANDLAADVTEEPPLVGAVSPIGTLATTWGKIRITK